MLKRITEYDTNLLIYLNNLGSAEQDVFWLLVTRIVFWIPLYISFFYLVFKNHTKRQSIRVVYTVAAMLVATFGITEVVKNFFLRARPVNNVKVYESLRVMIQPIDYSFFSGHACNSFAITTLFYLFLKDKMKYPWIFYIWPILFSYSRVYLGVHFPSDVLVGTVVGITIATVFYKLHNRLTLKSVQQNHIQ